MVKVLLVEDDDALRRLLRWALENNTFQVEEAHCLEDANRKAMRARYDLVVTDYQLSISDTSVALIRRIRSLEQPPPVVLMSGSAEWIHGLSIEKLGIHAFLPKPFHIDYFIKICRDAVNPPMQGPKSHPNA